MAMGKKGPGGLAVIIGGGKPGGGESEGGDMAMDAKRAAMGDLKAALDSGDLDAAAMAFKRAYDACAMAEGSEPEEY